MGKDKPAPTKLTLSVKDMIRYGISQISFTAARFNNYSPGNGLETQIVTSTIDFVIIWKFSDIRKGRANRYTIKKVDSKPIDT